MRKLLLSAALLCGLSTLAVAQEPYEPADNEIVSNGIVYTIIEGTQTVEASFTEAEEPADFTVQNLVIPETVTSKDNQEYTVVRIGSMDAQTGVFEDYTSIRSVTFPNTLKSIGKKAFCGCTNLETLNWGTGVEEIGSNAFDGCGLLTIDIPAPLKTLATNALANIGNMGNITLPATLTTMGEGQFVGMTILKSVTCHATTPPVVDSNPEYTTIPASCVLKVPASALEAYKVAPEWKLFKRFEALPAGDIGSGVNEVVAGEAVVNAADGAVEVNLPFAVYSLDGKCQYEGEAGRVALDKGVYVVRTSGKTLKVAL